MGPAVGAVLPLGIGVALSPIPIIAVVLMLATPRGRINGPAYVIGWVLGLAVAGTVVLAISASVGASDEQDRPAPWVSVLKLVLGIALVVLAVRQWRRRPRRDDEAALPGWMSSIDSFGPGKAIGLAVALSAVNPKNLLLVVAAATAIAQTGVSVGGQAVALAVFVVLGTLGPGLPLGAYYVLGNRSADLLDGLRRWMTTHNSAIMAVLLVVIGLKLVGDGLAALP
ncbi:GAP family protein [Actinomycetospora flava]|uniref:GAP family protein n=1 Tax=Actinomycetospora flava TaxID=3129232 RepID=A0ABU8MDK1_9PSEU